MIRTSIRLTDEMHQWYKAEAEKLGVPLNAMMIFALLQFQKEQMVLPSIPAMMKELEKRGQGQGESEDFQAYYEDFQKKLQNIKI